MRKRLTYIILLIPFCFLMTSCMNSIPELSEEENVMVVRYMADAVLEHDMYYESRLLTDEQVEKELIEEQKKAEKLKQIEEEEKKRKEEKAEENIPEDIEVAETVKHYFDSDISEYLGLSGLDFSYAGYRFANKLPEDDAQLAFVVAPSTSDNVLMLVEFDITNNSGDSSILVLPSQSKIKALVNGKKSVSPIITFLDEDLNCNIERIIESGQTVKGFLCYEIPKDENIESLNLSLSVSGKDKITVQL